MYFWATVLSLFSFSTVYLKMRAEGIRGHLRGDRLPFMPELHLGHDSLQSVLG